MSFKKAVKYKEKLRMGLFAPSGGGKTYTALLFAKKTGGTIAYIDTENRSSARYIGDPGIPEFDIAELSWDETMSGEAYVNKLVALINEASKSYDTIIVDSLTHAWSACKSEVDAAAQRMRTPNSYVAWREGSKLWSSVREAILNCQSYIIICARSKQDYVQEKDERGKTSIRKVGMAPELREGMEYELDIVCEIDTDHVMTVTKSRCSAVDGKICKKPTGEWLNPVLTWLGGVERPVEAIVTPVVPLVDQAKSMYLQLKGLNAESADAIKAEYGTDYEGMITALEARLA